MSTRSLETLQAEVDEIMRRHTAEKVEAVLLRLERGTDGWLVRLYYDENEEALLRSEMSKRAAAFAELGANWRDHMVRRYNFEVTVSFSPDEIFDNRSNGSNGSKAIWWP